MLRKNSSNRRFCAPHLGALLLGALLVFTSSAGAEGTLNVTISDIGPNQSSLDAINPNAASGGRVNGLATDPATNQTFYAASEYGGLFKSTDGGQTWVRLNGHVPTVTWDVEVDSSSSNRVFATSFYDGRVNSLSGINVSTNGGTTWVHPPTATPPTGFCVNAARRNEASAFGISIDPANPQNVYIGTNCGLAISSDSGVTWNYVDPTPADRADNIWDVAVHDGGIIDLCGDDGHLRSTDGGTTWTTATVFPRPRGGRCSIAVSPDEPYVIFVVAGLTIFESDDGGTTWTTFANPAPQGRIPFVATNDRAGTSFDLWFGDIQLFRAACTTPTPAAPGGALRCPTSANWINSQAGAHMDAGDIAFDSQVAISACPWLYSNDGGIYVETQGTSPACHTPAWEQPTVTPHALWLWDLAGADQPAAANEDVYFGNQDTGSFSATDAPAASPTWNNRDCCDVFDVSADSNRVVYTLCCWSLGRFNRVYIRNPGMTGGAELNKYPALGNVPIFRVLDSIDNFGPDDYVMITTSGVFVTQNITATPAVNWTPLGTASPPNACGIQAALSGGIPTFFVKSRGCNGDLPGSLWSYTGTAPGGVWQQITRAGNSAFGVFAVDPNNPNRILASDLASATGPQMVMSNDGGATWQNMPGLDNLMTGGGVFQYQNQRGFRGGVNFTGYPQPTLVAYDPEDANILVAGGVDSGVFISIDGGTKWELVTDPINPGISGKPHIPRPHHAYFDHEPASDDVNIYLGTRGRGSWRLSFKVSPPDLPDLIVDSLTHSPANPTIQDVITFTAVVKNIGTGPASLSTLEFRVGGETPGSSATIFAVPPLGSGQSFPVERQLVLGVAQNYRNTATADVNNDVLESNEANNQRTDAYRVRTVRRCSAIVLQTPPGDAGQMLVEWGLLLLPALLAAWLAFQGHRRRKLAPV